MGKLETSLEYFIELSLPSRLWLSAVSEFRNKGKYYICTSLERFG